MDNLVDLHQLGDWDQTLVQCHGQDLFELGGEPFALLVSWPVLKICGLVSHLIHGELDSAAGDFAVFFTVLLRAIEGGGVSRLAS